MLVCSVFTVFYVGLYCGYKKRSISEVVIKDFNNNIVLVKLYISIIWLSLWLPPSWKISPEAFPFVSHQFYIFERPAEEVGVFAVGFTVIYIDCTLCSDSVFDILTN